MGEREKKLTAYDYMNEPVMHLVRHPDFKKEAFLVCLKMQALTTEELLALEKLI